VCSGAVFSLRKSWWFTRPSNTVIIVDRNAVVVSNIFGEKKHVTCRAEKTFALRACDWCCTSLLLLFSLSHSLFLSRLNHMVHRIRATECQRLLVLHPSHPTRSQYQPWPAGREIDVIARSKHILFDPT